MSHRPFRYTNSLDNNSAIKEFLVSEEDYLAYRAGVYLGRITKEEASALRSDQTGRTVDVGYFEDTVYNLDNPSRAATTISRTYNVTAVSDVSNETHSTEFVTPVPLPPMVYTDDTVAITININASVLNGSTGFQELTANLLIDPSPNATISNITTTPAATSIEGTLVNWEDYDLPELTGVFSVTYELSFTDVGYVQATLQVSSTDIKNVVAGSGDNFNSIIRVEPADSPGEESVIITPIYQKRVYCTHHR